jgi:hypothetical protein
VNVQEPDVSEQYTTMPRFVVLRNLIAHANQVQAIEAARELEELLNQLELQFITIVVAGQYSRGKTTLVNALLGAALLPTGLLPVTAVPTVITRGAPRAAHVQYADGRYEKIALNALATIVSERENPNNVLAVRRVELTLPEWPFEKVHIVDAPGVATPSDLDGRAADSSLRLADLAILVVGPEPPITAAELAFACTVHAASQKLFVVLNKADLAEGALDEVVTFTREQLTDRLGFAPPLYTLDARAALRGSGNPGFDTFRRDIAGFIAQHGDRVLAISIDRRALVTARELARTIELERVATSAPRDARLRALGQLRSIKEELEISRRELVVTYRTGLSDDLDSLNALIEQWARPEHDVIETRVNRFVDGGDVSGVRTELDAATADTVGRWSSRARARLEAAGTARGERLLRELDDLRARSVGPVLAALGATQFAETPTPPTVVLGTIEPTVAYATTAAELTLQAFFKLLPRSIRKRHLSRSIGGQIDERLDQSRGSLMAKARDLFRVAGEKSASALTRWFDAEIATVHIAIERAAQVNDVDLVSRVAELQGLERAVTRAIANLTEAP